MKNRIVVIIPARYASTRLPGKPLIPLRGKPMIQRVYERAAQIPGVDRVLVATDDSRILETVQDFGGEACLTPGEIRNGSERVGFVARQLEAEIVVNLQGDEPLISTRAVGAAVQRLLEDSRTVAATLGYPLKTEAEWRNPAVVKVITDANGNTLYFSRAPIPFHRDEEFSPLPFLYRHIGVYVFRKSFLMEFLSWPEGTLEAREKLEQLRILERGYSLKLVEADTLSPGVDTPEDLEVVERMLAMQSEECKVRGRTTC